MAALPDCQYRFRTDKFTYDTLLKLKEVIKVETSKGKIVMAIVWI